MDAYTHTHNIVTLKNTYHPFPHNKAKGKYNQSQLTLCVEILVSELDTDDRKIPAKTIEQTVT